MMLHSGSDRTYTAIQLLSIRRASGPGGLGTMTLNVECSLVQFEIGQLHASRKHLRVLAQKHKLNN